MLHPKCIEQNIYIIIKLRAQRRQFIWTIILYIIYLLSCIQDVCGKNHELRIWCVLLQHVCVNGGVARSVAWWLRTHPFVYICPKTTKTPRTIMVIILICHSETMTNNAIFPDSLIATVCGQSSLGYMMSNRQWGEIRGGWWWLWCDDIPNQHCVCNTCHIRGMQVRWQMVICYNICY